MLNNQYVLFAGSGAFHCMEVYTNDGKTGYVIDYCEGIHAVKRNDHVSVEYDGQYWRETSRTPRVSAADLVAQRLYTMPTPKRQQEEW
jgi:hypothetical protein